MDGIWMPRIASIVMLYALIPFWRQMVWVGNRYFTIMTVFAMLYPIGKALQLWLIGPSWVRWYMNDVGWISCVAVILPNLMRHGPFLERLSTGVHVGFVIAITVELWQMSVASYVNQKLPFSAAGDVVDLAIFVVMYGVNLGLIHLMKPKAPPVATVQRKRRKRALNHR